MEDTETKLAIPTRIEARKRNHSPEISVCSRPSKQRTYMTHVDFSYILPQGFSIFKLNNLTKSDNLLADNVDVICDKILNANLKDRKEDCPRDPTLLKHFVTSIQKNLRRVHLGKMVQHHCPYTSTPQNSFKPVDKVRIVRLFRAIFHKVIPKEMFPNRKLQETFLQNLTLKLTSGKGSEIFLGQLMKGLEPDLFDWLTRIDPKVEVRERVLTKVIFWLANHFFWKILRLFFHASDSSSTRNEWVFYHKQNFQQLLDKYFSQMTKTNSSLEPITVDFEKETIEEKNYQLSMCRILPKKSSVRLICRRFLQVNSYEETVGLNEKSHQLLLAYAVKKMYLESVDVRGFKFHKMWSKFASTVRMDSSKKVYVVVADIRDAFGSVILSKMIDILAEISTKLPKTMFIHEFERCSVRFREHVMSCREKVNDSVDYKKSPTKLDVKDNFNRIALKIQTNITLLNVGGKKKYFRVKRGLLQGHPLSPVLCDVYCGHLVQNYLSEFKDDHSESLLCRGMDDFIFATPDKARAQRFLQIMRRGFPEYGCVINPEKTVTNLEPHEKPLKAIFCGSLIDLETLSCRPDFSGYFDQNIAYATTMKTDYYQDVESFITKRMMFLVNLNVKPLYLDLELNGTDLVKENLFEIYFVAALRFNSLCLSLIFYDDPEPKKIGFLYKIIRISLNKAWKRVREVCQKYTISLDLTESDCSHIYFKAFEIVLTRRYTYYKSVVDSLRIEMARLEKKIPQQRLLILHRICSIVTLEKRKTNRIISKAYQTLILRSTS